MNALRIEENTALIAFMRPLAAGLVLALSPLGCGESTSAAPTGPGADASDLPETHPPIDEPDAQPPASAGYVAGSGWRPLGITSDDWLIALHGDSQVGDEVKAISLTGAGPDVDLVRAGWTSHKVSGKTVFTVDASGALWAWSAAHGLRRISAAARPFLATADGETLAFAERAAGFSETMIISDFEGGNRREGISGTGMYEAVESGGRIFASAYDGGLQHFSSIDVATGAANEMPPVRGWVLDRTSGQLVGWDEGGTAWLAPLTGSPKTTIASDVEYGVLVEGGAAFVYLDTAGAVVRQPLPSGPRLTLCTGADYFWASPDGADVALGTQISVDATTDLRVSHGSQAGSCAVLVPPKLPGVTRPTWTAHGNHLFWLEGQTPWGTRSYWGSLHAWTPGASAPSTLLDHAVDARMLRGEAVLAFDTDGKIHRIDLSSGQAADQVLDTFDSEGYAQLSPSRGKLAYLPRPGDGIRVLDLP